MATGNIGKIKASRVNRISNVESYVGESGILFFNFANGVIRLSDGVTPGGVPIPYTIASNTTIGGIKAGPGTVISNDGQLFIDTANLALSFGHFTANNNILSIVNANEDMILSTEGNATIKLVGNIEFRHTDSVPGTGNIFISASDSGFMSVYAPNVAANTSGALNIVGSSTGSYQPVRSAGGMFHITGNDGVSNRINFDAFGANAFPSIIGRTARGTAASPSATQSGDILLRISTLGWAEPEYNTTGVGGPPTSIDFVATDNYTHSVYGSKIAFYTSPQGSIGRNLSMTIDSTGISTGNVVATGTFRYDIANNNATVTQLTSKSTAVTANGRTGQITTNNAALAQGTSVTFTVNNTYVSSTDVIILNIKSGATTDSYSFDVTAVNNGSFNIQIRNFTNGSLSDAIVFNFAVIKVS